MKKRVSIVFVLMGIALISSSCTGLKKQMLQSYLKKTDDLKAVGLKLKEPPAPYIKKEHDILDGFWLNKEQASSISYFSSCSQVPRSLKAFQTSSYPSELSYKVLKRVKKADSFYSVLEIQKDSKGKEREKRKEKTKEKTSRNSIIAVYSKREKNCFFNLNLVAPSQKIFQEESAVFQDFIQNFKPLGSD